LSVDETKPSITEGAQMNIYPNPTQSEAIVYMNYSSEFSVALFDLSGKEISTTVFQGEQTTVNLNTLKSGIYLVTVRDAKNGNQMTSRVIKN